MRKRFELVEHTADIALRVYGDTLEQLFIHAAQGFFEILGDYRDPKESIEKSVTLQADGLEDLFRDWLTELNFQHQTCREVYHRFEIRTLSESGLEAMVWGEPIDPERHNIELEIKAVTYHRLEVRKTHKGWQGFVVLDI